MESEMLSLTETKFKGYGEVSWCEVNGIIAGERAKGRCGYLDEWQSAVINIESVRFKTLRVKFKFSMVKYVWPQ